MQTIRLALFKRDDIYKICILLSDKHTRLMLASKLVQKLSYGT